MKNIAIIVARGGSKRIPRKNIRPFHGKPILEYSVKAALDSGLFTEVMVSTEDQEIAAVAKAAGAQLPFLRSAQNADDFAPVASVVAEVLQEYAKRGQSFDQFCCLFATAPFVTSASLKEAMQALAQKQVDTVVPVVRFGFPIQRAFRLVDGAPKLIQPEHLNSRSQDLEPSYHDAGQFYCGKVPAFLASNRLFADRSWALVLPESEVQDIDSEEDWKIAELKFSLRQK